uniref:MOSC domain-containing protein n=1 Tax=Knipowitschia caucasica TaxID=637954 RepID=A0AAV2JLU5_KNICA
MERSEERDVEETGASPALRSAHVFDPGVSICWTRAPHQVRQWPLGAHGLLYDRGWMVVNVNGVCLSQKREPRLCLIRPEVQLQRDTLLLRAPGMESLSVPLEANAQSQVCQSRVCGDRVETQDCGEAAADWLSDFLGQTCRLIRLNSGFTRDAKKKKRTKQQESSREDAASSPLSLVNEAQYLMINRTSAEHIHRIIHNRDDLTSDQNLFLDVDNVVSRFRANLVVSAATAFKEDEWSQLTITNTVFTVTGKCSRCHMVGINQETGDRTMEPLRTLSVYRDQGKVTFGVYLSHQLPQDSSRTTVLRVGSRVQPQTISSPGPDPV